MLYAFWAEDDNYNGVLRPAYAGRLPVPLCFYVPWTMRRRVLSQLARRGALREGAAYATGGAALEALAVRLAGRDSFFPSGPSGADACGPLSRRRRQTRDAKLGGERQADAAGGGARLCARGERSQRCARARFGARAYNALREECRPPPLIGALAPAHLATLRRDSPPREGAGAPSPTSPPSSAARSLATNFALSCARCRRSSDSSNASRSVSSTGSSRYSPRRRRTLASCRRRRQAGPRASRMPGAWPQTRRTPLWRERRAAQSTPGADARPSRSASSGVRATPSRVRSPRRSSMRSQPTWWAGRRSTRGTRRKRTDAQPFPTALRTYGHTHGQTDGRPTGDPRATRGRSCRDAQATRMREGVGGGSGLRSLVSSPQRTRRAAPERAREEAMACRLGTEPRESRGARRGLARNSTTRPREGGLACTCTTTGKVVKR